MVASHEVAVRLSVTIAGAPNDSLFQVVDPFVLLHPSLLRKSHLNQSLRR